MIVYVYREANDDAPLTAEIVETYYTRKKAEKRLREQVEKWAGVSFENVVKTLDFDNSDTFKKDYVSYCDLDGVCFIFSVTEMEVI